MEVQTPKDRHRVAVTGQATDGLANLSKVQMIGQPMQNTLIAGLVGLMMSATSGLAETPMTATEFEAYATGKTLTYSVGGEVYGAEQYLPDRRVIWAFKGNTCTDGIWFEKEGLICFAYENEPDTQCWNFYSGPDGLRAEFTGDPAESPLSEVNQTSIPLNCAGPDVGV